jgi:hypothetical protein
MDIEIDIPYFQKKNSQEDTLQEGGFNRKG